MTRKSGNPDVYLAREPSRRGLMTLLLSGIYDLPRTYLTPRFSSPSREHLDGPCIVLHRFRTPFPSMYFHARLDQGIRQSDIKISFTLTRRARLRGKYSLISSGVILSSYGTRERFVHLLASAHQVHAEIKTKRGQRVRWRIWLERVSPAV